VKFVAFVLLLAPFAAAGETTYLVASPAGPIALEVRDDRMRLRLPSPTDLETSTLALEALLARAYAAGGLPIEGSINVGRVIEHPWLSELLARAALRSSRWDSGRGTARTGNDNLAVMQLIDDEKLLAAWVPIFGRYGVAIRNTVVEKVLVGRVGETDALQPLAQDPSAVGRQLPFDAILWLRLEPRGAW
jgi:hypothetical protein